METVICVRGIVRQKIIEVFVYEASFLRFLMPNQQEYRREAAEMLRSARAIGKREALFLWRGEKLLHLHGDDTPF